MPDELMVVRDSQHFTSFAADHLSTTLVATDGGAGLLALVIVGVGEVIQLGVDRAARGMGVGVRSPRGRRAPDRGNPPGGVAGCRSGQ